MHEAYELSHLITVAVQIEAIAAYDSFLLLGTRQGHLLMYSLGSGNANQKYEVQMLHYCKNFSKKPIQQIEVIPEDNLLLCLTDNVLTTHSINSSGNFPLVKTFLKTKGASLFAIDYKQPMTSLTGESNSVVCICVAVRRKIQLYYGKNGEFKQHLFDFNIPDVPKVMALSKDFLCVGFKGEYTVYEISSGNPKELFPASSSKFMEPSIAKFSETSFLLGRDQTSVLVGEKDDNETIDLEIKKTIKWKDVPINVVWDEPYIIGLLDNEVVVQSVDPAQFMQSLDSLHKARLIYKCKRGLIFLSSVGQVWCLSAVDVAKQLTPLLKEKQFKIALDLTNLSDCSPEEKQQKIHSIRKLYAYDLFYKKDYTASMKEFSKLNTDPAEVIKLIPELDGKSGESGVKKLKGMDLENAINALIVYLVDLRAIIAKGPAAANLLANQEGSQRNIAQQLELIDTTLLKCYLQTNDAFVAPLLRLNNCRLDEAEKTLLQYGKHSELIILYHTKGQHSKALQLLKLQAKQPDSSLEGYRGTRNYLQQLGSEHLNIIFKFSGWILEEYPEEGLKIFTEDLSAVKSLPRPKVLDFLLREHDPLVIPYLEHVIHTWNDQNPLFHDILINMYREKITDKKATITEEESQHIKSKLVSFLEKSAHYTPERILLNFPTDSLFEERAIVLGKLGRHEQALAIYILILGDIERAIRYCGNVYEATKEVNQDVYVILMNILINPEQAGVLSGPLAKVQRHPKTATPDLETALDILEKHADKISPLKALSVLPDSVPLIRLKHFLESSIESQLTLKRRTQVLKGLYNAEHIQVQELKQFHESKSVVIDDGKLCPVCNKKFGNQSAFVRYPTGEIVHYSCRLEK